MTEKLNICVVTGSRAEFGLMKPLLSEINNSSECTLNLVVTGSHLLKDQKNSLTEIRDTGFTISKKIKIIDGEREEDIVHSVGKLISALSNQFSRNKPDWLILVGDRYETFGAAVSAHLMNIPIAHIHGGEVTTGATDDALRHSITKMSYLHFTACDEYRNRVIQLGEDPRRVFNTGALAVDGIKGLQYISKTKLESILDFTLSGPIALITFHPVTLAYERSIEEFKALLRYLKTLKHWTLIFSRPNADAGNKEINLLIDSFCEKHNGAISFTNLGQQKYLSLMKIATLVVGNSSSGILEAPYFYVPSIDIGDRQNGRIKAKSVIHTKGNYISIKNAFDLAQKTEFVQSIKNQILPFGNKPVCKNIFNKILKMGKVKNLQKSFYNLKI